MEWIQLIALAVLLLLVLVVRFLIAQQQVPASVFYPGLAITVAVGLWWGWRQRER